MGVVVGVVRAGAQGSGLEVRGSGDTVRGETQLRVQTEFGPVLS